MADNSGFVLELNNMKNKNSLSSLLLGSLFIFLVISIISGRIFILAQIDDGELVVDEKTDKIDVVYAIEGNLVDEDGNVKYFMFGVVRLHKTWSSRGVSKDKWSSLLLYFEMDNRSTIASILTNDLFKGIPRVKELTGSFSEFEFSKYNQEKVSEEEGDSHIFELNFVFTENGEMDINNSSVGIIPSQYKFGRDAKIYGPTGNFYKKGSESELFVPILDEEKKIINTDEMGDPVYDLITVRVKNICYEQLTFDETNLCPIYKISNILNSTGPLPDAYKLGIITEL